MTAADVSTTMAAIGTTAAQPLFETKPITIENMNNEKDQVVEKKPQSNNNNIVGSSCEEITSKKRTRADTNDDSDDHDKENLSTTNNTITPSLVPTVTKVESTYDKKNTANADNGSDEQQQTFSPDLLRMYYSRLFPYKLITDWLSYNKSALAMPASSQLSESGSLLSRREFSFTLKLPTGDEIYSRYNSFSTEKEFKSAISKKQPIKIDIGAVFTHPPKNKNSFSSSKFTPEQRELVFDIDLTDYDCVRNCGCKEARVCNKCWKMMSMAMKVMDVGLKEDFGFKDICWFFSGRRGVHCWVSDERARCMSNEERSAVVSYFEVSLEIDKTKPSWPLPTPLHPLLMRSFQLLEPLFIRDIIPEHGHGILATEVQWTKFLATLPDSAAPVSTALLKRWKNDDGITVEDKWEDVKKYVANFLNGSTSSPGATSAKSKKNHLSPMDKSKLLAWKYQIVFAYTYPRLDINVSKMQNHLLKCPFCIHPKTGKVCIPMDLNKVEEFDLEAVPTLLDLKQELDDTMKQKEVKVEEDSKSSQMEEEWRRTTLNASFDFFEKKILEPMLKRLP